MASAGLPQLTQIYLTKSVDGLNILTYLMIVGGNSMMVIYAIELAMNGIGFVLLVTTALGTLVTGAILLLIIYYRYIKKPIGRRW